MGAFSAGGVILRIARPQLRTQLNPLSMRMLTISLAAIAVIPLAGCAVKGVSFLNDPVVPTAHGLVSRYTWFTKNYPEWCDKQSDACHKFISVSGFLFIQVDITTGTRIAWDNIGLPDANIHIENFPEKITLNDDIGKIFWDYHKLMLRKGKYAIFKIPNQNSPQRDCLCIEGDCRREWNYAFGVQNPGE